MKLIESIFNAFFYESAVYPIVRRAVLEANLGLGDPGGPGQVLLQGEEQVDRVLGDGTVRLDFTLTLTSPLTSI